MLPAPFKVIDEAKVAGEDDNVDDRKQVDGTDGIQRAAEKQCRDEGDAHDRQGQHQGDRTGDQCEKINGHVDYRRAMSNPMSMPTPADRPTATHGFSWTYRSVSLAS